jgi:uncharacterized protein YggU (UPF0235/DUF167 family)
VGSEPAVPWREEKGAIVVHVRLTPRGGRDQLEGIETLSDGRAVLKARVRAAPEKGLANAALVELLAGALDVPKSAVSVVSGATSRVKSVRVTGNPTTLRKSLETFASRSSRPAVPRVPTGDGGA